MNSDDFPENRVQRKRLRIVKTPILNNRRSQHGDYGKPAQNVGFATVRALIAPALAVSDASIRTRDDCTVRFLTKFPATFAEICETPNLRKYET
jgi:hypothetical protein